MKKSIKLMLVLLALALVCVFCIPALAEGDPDASADPTEDASALPTDSTATTGDDAADTEEKPDPTLRVYDANGKEVTDMSAMSCISGQVDLYIKHAYTLVFGYADGTKLVETDDQIVIEASGSDCVSVDHNTVKLAPSDKPYTLTVKINYPKMDDGVYKYTSSVKRFNVGLPDIIVGALGIYVIVNVITGKGSLFSDEYIKEDKKAKFKLIIRILAAVAGLMFLTAAVTAICFSYLDWVKIARYVFFGIGLLALIAIIIVSNSMTDKEKRRKAQASPMTGGSTASSAAFEFDGTEPTVDDVLADLEKQKKDGE